MRWPDGLKKRDRSVPDSGHAGMTACRLATILAVWATRTSSVPMRPMSALRRHCPRCPGLAAGLAKRPDDVRSSGAKQTSRRRADTSGFDNGHRRRIDANNLDRKAHYFSRILDFYPRYMMSPAIFAAEARSCICPGAPPKWPILRVRSPPTSRSSS
jgi:hypothetical protein